MDPTNLFPLWSARDRQQRLLREVEADRQRRAIGGAGQVGAVRRLVGVAVIRFGAWVAGQALPELPHPKGGRLRSAG